VKVLVTEQRARWFFAAPADRAGTGAAHVALLAYDRVRSAWGAAAVRLADVAPADRRHRAAAPAG
jgi:hypothetical protein